MLKCSTSCCSSKNIKNVCIQKYPGLRASLFSMSKIMARRAFKTSRLPLYGVVFSLAIRGRCLLWQFQLVVSLIVSLGTCSRKFTTEKTGPEWTPVARASSFVIISLIITNNSSDGNEGAAVSSTICILHKFVNDDKTWIRQWQSLIHYQYKGDRVVWHRDHFCFGPQKCNGYIYLFLHISDFNKMLKDLNPVSWWQLTNE